MTTAIKETSFSIKKIKKIQKEGNKINHSDLIEYIDDYFQKTYEILEKSFFINEGGTESTSQWDFASGKSRIVVFLNHTTAEPYFPPRITVMMRKGILIPIFRYSMKQYGTDEWKKEIKENLFREITTTVIPIILKECSIAVEDMKSYLLTTASKDNLILDLYRLNHTSKGSYDRPMGIRNLIQIEDRLGNDESFSFYSIAKQYQNQVKLSNPNRQVIEHIKFWELCIKKFDKCCSVPKI